MAKVKYENIMQDWDAHMPGIGTKIEEPAMGPIALLFSKLKSCSRLLKRSISHNMARASSNGCSRGGYNLRC